MSWYLSCNHQHL